MALQCLKVFLPAVSVIFSVRELDNWCTTDASWSPFKYAAIETPKVWNVDFEKSLKWSNEC